MNETEIQYSVEPSPDAIARAREIYRGASAVRSDSLCEKKRNMECAEAFIHSCVIIHPLTRSASTN